MNNAQVAERTLPLCPWSPSNKKSESASFLRHDILHVRNLWCSEFALSSPPHRIGKFINESVRFPNLTRAYMATMAVALDRNLFLAYYRSMSRLSDDVFIIYGLSEITVSKAEV